MHSIIIHIIIIHIIIIHIIIITNETDVCVFHVFFGGTVLRIFSGARFDNKERRVSVPCVRVVPRERVFQGVLPAEPAHAGAVPVSQWRRRHVPARVQGPVRVPFFCAAVLMRSARASPPSFRMSALARAATTSHGRSNQRHRRSNQRRSCSSLRHRRSNQRRSSSQRHRRSSSYYS